MTRYQKTPLLCNEAILQSDCDIICIMDGDAICSPNFISSIISSFERFEKVLVFIDELRHGPITDWDYIMAHIDKYNLHNRNIERNTTSGINDLINRFGTTLLDINMVLCNANQRNYGACFCALKRDLIRVGGADEHEGFEGMFSGPFEIGWRLLPFGFREYWHPTEFLVHPWHQGTDGGNSAHKTPPMPDGCPFMNTYAINRLADRLSGIPDPLEGLPLVENEKIKNIRLN